MLTIVDEYTRECLAIDVARRMISEDVLERLRELFIRRGVPDYIRSDNGAEFPSQAFGLCSSYDSKLYLRQGAFSGWHRDLFARSPMNLGQMEIV